MDERVSATAEKLEASIQLHEAMYPNDPKDRLRLYCLFTCLGLANGLAPGDYLELGVHRGLTLKFIHTWMDRKQTLIGIDTFEGFDARDLEHEHTKKWKPGNFLPTSIEQVGRYLGEPANLALIKDWWPRAFELVHHRRWRFVHIDVDLYEPTRTALDLLWEKMVPGGIIAVHDYNCTDFGARRAVDRFCDRLHISPDVVGDLRGTAVIRKP